MKFVSRHISPLLSQEPLTLKHVEHFRGTRRSVVTLVCGVAIGFAASSDTSLLLGVAWLLAAFGYAETRYLAGERLRPLAVWALGVAGLAGVLLVQEEYRIGMMLGLIAAVYAIQAWWLRSEEQQSF